MVDSIALEAEGVPTAVIGTSFTLDVTGKATGRGLGYPQLPFVYLPREFKAALYHYDIDDKGWNSMIADCTDFKLNRSGRILAIMPRMRTSV